MSAFTLVCFMDNSCAQAVVYVWYSDGHF